MSQWSSHADVEQFRHLTHRYAVARRVDRPTLVLGSTQSDEVLDPSAVRTWAGDVVRRRGGGGAVLLLPGDHLWIDAWIPRDDPLWEGDVSEAAAWAGTWWRASLEACRASDLEVHRGGATTDGHQAVCFSGRGPGEVFHRGAKVTGVSQWRCREGALFHTCAYTHWDPAPLVALLALDDAARTRWGQELAGSAVGLEDLGDAGVTMADVTEILLCTFADWKTNLG
jgi:lipoate-protein ligase A